MKFNIYSLDIGKNTDETVEIFKIRRRIFCVVNSLLVSIMSEKTKSSRTRAPNFTKQDQIILIDAIKPYQNIIESKQTDTVKQADKQSAWLTITQIFNANTLGQARTVDNLISCYRNIKTKIKKQRSDAKMLLKDPAQRGALINAIEKEGTSWENVASTSSWSDAQLCENGFEELKKEAQKEENKRKRSLMGTGGGPHVPDKHDELEEIKKMIEPQIEGLFTIYDGDSGLMSQFQKTVPESQRIDPIDASFVECKINNKESFLSEQIIQEDIIKTPIFKNRNQILRKKKDPALSHKETSFRKPGLQDSFKEVSEAKLELVQIQKQIAQQDYEHKQRMQEIEIEEVIKENKFKEKMREKELELIQLKIDKA